MIYHVFRSCFVSVALVEHGLYVVVLRMDSQMNLSACYWANSMGRWSNCCHQYVMSNLSGPQITKDKTKNDSSCSQNYFNFGGESVPRIGLPQYAPCHAPSKVEWSALTTLTTETLLCAVSVLWKFWLEGVHRMIWGASSLRQWVRGYGNPGWHWGKWQWRVSVKRQTFTHREYRVSN